MIKINRISIRNMRGIKTLDLEFGEENFGICGPNGTGKSGVVDALEFALTGDMTRLRRKGSSELSLSKHGPHVDSLSKPESSRVSIWGHLPNIKEEVRIIRSVNTPSKTTVVPDTEKIRLAVKRMENQPEFALSRREIVKYILTPPGERATDVQTLLKLEELDKIRKSLTTVANSATRVEKAAATEFTRAKNDFTSCLKITDQKKQSVLDALNANRNLLGLTPIDTLEDSTQFVESKAPSDSGEDAHAFLKSRSLADMEQFFSDYSAETQDALNFRKSVCSELKELKQDVSSFKKLRTHSLIQSGLDLLDGDYCPLCEVEWNENELRTLLSTKQNESDKLKKVIESLETKLKTSVFSFKTLRLALEKILRFGKILKLTFDQGEFQAAIDECSRKEELVATDIISSIIVDDLLQVFSNPILKTIPSGFQTIKDAMSALPEQSAEEVARNELVLAQVNFDKYHVRKKELALAKERSSLASSVRDHFNDAHVATLNSIYDTVSEDFTKFYRNLNAEDEGNFSAKFTPEPSKLTLSVDFYGRGKFPPGAFHSEGHQDGMGLCLYLALMKHTLGGEFRFCVLDDVLMSVDISHRRQVCRLLKAEFPNTQFIITTHDRIWVKYMKSEGLIKNSISFFGWSVELGPQIWDDMDVWEDIERSLEANDVPRAGFTLRRYLEYVGHAFCDGLRAPVNFRGDGNYSLGDLLPSSMARINKKMREAKTAAVSWGKNERAEQLDQKQKDFALCLQKSRVDQWAVNPVVHYNEWANLDSAEFGALTFAFKDLFEYISCTQCGGFLHLTYTSDFKEDSMKCTCGELQYDLKKKKT